MLKSVIIRTKSIIKYVFRRDVLFYTAAVLLDLCSAAVMATRDIYPIFRKLSGTLSNYFFVFTRITHIVVNNIRS